MIILERKIDLLFAEPKVMLPKLVTEVDITKLVDMQDY